MLDHADRSKGFTIEEDHLFGGDWETLRAVALAETRRILDSDAQAQDAAQEAVIRAWRYARTCAVPDEPTAWLRVIARREALRLLNRRPPETTAVDFELPVATVGSDPLELRALLVECLSELDRRLVFSRYWAGLTHAEISAATGLPVGTVKTRLHRARRALRSALESSASGRGRQPRRG